MTPDPARAGGSPSLSEAMVHPQPAPKQRILGTPVTRLQRAGTTPGLPVRQKGGAPCRSAHGEAEQTKNRSTVRFPASNRAVNSVPGETPGLLSVSMIAEVPAKPAGHSGAT